MSNRELPMMPWYPDQFAASTASWCWQERALYRALLDAQWALGSLPENAISLSRIVSMRVQVFSRLWETVRHKFQRLPNGTLQNFRLEQHRLACLRHKESKRLGARLTNAKRWDSESLSDHSALTERVASVSPPSPSPSPSPEEDLRNPPTPLTRGAEFLEINGRQVRDQSRSAWRAATVAIDEIAHSEPPLTWAHLNQTLPDPIALSAIDAAGGARAIADRGRFTTKELQVRFREAYEDAALKP